MLYVSIQVKLVLKFYKISNFLDFFYINKEITVIKLEISHKNKTFSMIYIIHIF